MTYAYSFIKLVQDRGSLSECELYVGVGTYGEEIAATDSFQLEVLVENDVADYYVNFAFEMAIENISRFLWLIEGWPHRMLGCLEETAVEGTML